MECPFIVFKQYIKSDAEIDVPVMVFAAGIFPLSRIHCMSSSQSYLGK